MHPPVFKPKNPTTLQGIYLSGKKRSQDNFHSDKILIISFLTYKHCSVHIRIMYEDHSPF